MCETRPDEIHHLLIVFDAYTQVVSATLREQGFFCYQATWSLSILWTDQHEKRNSSL